VQKRKISEVGIALSNKQNRSEVILFFTLQRLYVSLDGFIVLCKLIKCCPWAFVASLAAFGFKLIKYFAYYLCHMQPNRKHEPFRNSAHAPGFIFLNNMFLRCIHHGSPDC
jgi:hypothetical protein